ncbi:hypothetical protein [Acrocarpospora sp. B8E8]|uniref:hypothetical protein n=1 Tax=Acrocarpospora sp. B8E8 TaxID=3153572 RepID=UPI00325C6643
MTDDYRKRLAAALAQAECEKRPRCVECMGDAVLAVRDEEMEKLRAEVEKLRKPIGDRTDEHSAKIAACDHTYDDVVDDDFGVRCYCGKCGTQYTGPLTDDGYPLSTEAGGAE